MNEKEARKIIKKPLDMSASNDVSRFGYARAVGFLEGLEQGRAEAERQVAVAVEALEDYGKHTWHCIRSLWCAGEPTKDGGYREKFGDKWYQSGPVDETPRCNCGFDEALSKLRKVGEKVNGRCCLNPQHSDTCQCMRKEQGKGIQLSDKTMKDFRSLVKGFADHLKSKEQGRGGEAEMNEKESFRWIMNEKEAKGILMNPEYSSDRTISKAIGLLEGLEQGRKEERPLQCDGAVTLIADLKKEWTTRWEKRCAEAEGRVKLCEGRVAVATEALREISDEGMSAFAKEQVAKQALSALEQSENLRKEQGREGEGG